jgi:heme exporter protein D
MEALKEIAESFRQHLATGMWKFYILLIALGLFSLSFIIIYRVIEPIRKRRAFVLAAFYQLARINNLDRRECKTLKVLARSIGLKNPSLLFVKPSLFEKSLQNFPGKESLFETLKKKLYE